MDFLGWLFAEPEHGIRSLISRMPDNPADAFTYPVRAVSRLQQRMDSSARQRGSFTHLALA
jgi:hypothetical protein